MHDARTHIDKGVHACPHLQIVTHKTLSGLRVETCGLEDMGDSLGATSSLYNKVHPRL